ncbi:MAG: hypothetical protein LQ338_007619 [Usnochroma carphineum]|nr:MAG: hypothetical protein LQ338_007619 [Usnochroma carphineum]
MWRTLEGLKGGSSKDNVGPVSFEYGLITTQKTKTAKCRDDRRALAHESDAQLKPLREFKGGTIRTKRGKNDRFFLVEVHRDENAEDEGIRYDPEKILGQSYILRAPKTFPSDKEIMKANEPKKRHGFWVDLGKLNRRKSRIPTDVLFGDFKCDKAENQLLVPTDFELPPRITEKLNESQKDVELGVGSRVSIAQGLPGTGKSTTLAALIFFLVKTKDEKVAGVTTANVAVDTLLNSCMKMWQELEPDTPISFIRVYSESITFSQWAARDLDRLNSPYHIDFLRSQLAVKFPGSHTAY